jgi:hypothetical protein
VNGLHRRCLWREPKVRAINMSFVFYVMVALGIIMDIERKKDHKDTFIHTGHIRIK